MAVLDPFRSELVVVNPAEQAVLARVTARKADGTLHVPADGANPAVIALSAGEAVRADLEDLFGFRGDTFLEGWLEVSSNSAALDGSLIYSVPPLGSVAAVASPVQGMKEGLFCHLATALDYFTGLAVLNPGSLTANFTVVALDPGGTVLGSYSSVLAPGHRTSLLITEMIEASAGYGGGFIWLQSDQPLYLTSLFGSSRSGVLASSGVLANIPPQPVPSDYAPDPRPAPLSVEPRLAVLQPSAVQVFRAAGAAGAVQWMVNGHPGGSPEFGLVDAAGVYRAPEVLPSPPTLSITATTGAQTAGASVDLLTKNQLMSGLGTVQALAYLESLRTLYTAELVGGGAAAADGQGPRVSQQTAQTLIRDVTSGVPATVAALAGETVPAMLPLTASDGNEYLLLVARESGTLKRLNPRNGDLVTMVSGLEQPAAIALDEADGELLVAEATQVRVIPLELVTAAGTELPSPQQTIPGRRLLQEGFGQVVVDQCTGNVYGALPTAGTVLEFSRATGGVREVVSGLQRPTRLLGLYRRGVGCPSAFHLLVLERDAGFLTILIPASGFSRRWLEVSEAGPMLLLPPDNPFEPTDTLLVAEVVQGVQRLTRVPLTGVYSVRSVNPPPRNERAPCAIRQVTELDEGSIPAAVISGDGRWIFYSSWEDPAGRNADGSLEVFALDRLQRLRYQVTDSPEGETEVLSSGENGARVLVRSTAQLTPFAPPSGTHLYLLETASGQAWWIPVSGASTGLLDGAGDTVVFAASADPVGENADGGAEIFLLELPGQQLRQLSHSATGSAGRPALSADGEVVAWLTVDRVADTVSLQRWEASSGEVETVAVVGTAAEWEEIAAPLLNGTGSTLIFSSRADLLGENPTRHWMVYRVGSDGLPRRISPQGADSVAGSVDTAGQWTGILTRANAGRLNEDRNQEVGLLGVEAEPLRVVTRSRRTLNLPPMMDHDGNVLIFRSNGDYTARNPDRGAEIFVAECLP